MPDDFRDSLRQAAGIPTTAEREAEAKRAAREKTEWDSAEPTRKQYQEYFKSTVNPLIDQCLADAQEVAKETRLPHEIIDSTGTIIGAPDPKILARRSFHLQRKTQIPNRSAAGSALASAMIPRPAVSVGALQFTLFHTGTLAIEVPEKNQMGGVRESGVLVLRVGLPDVLEGFKKLMATMKR